jgi:hypothetical protein
MRGLLHFEVARAAAAGDQAMMVHTMEARVMPLGFRIEFAPSICRKFRTSERSKGNLLARGFDKTTGVHPVTFLSLKYKRPTGRFFTRHARTLKSSVVGYRLLFNRQ